MENKSGTGSFIYFDNHSTTPVDERVGARMLPYLSEIYGNPHSNDHYFGWGAKKAVDAARRDVASFVGADADEIVFTSGATEANNLAIFGSLNALKATQKKKIIISAFEHKCVLQAAKAAEMQGFEVVYLTPSREGFIEPTQLLLVLGDDVGLVSIMTVNNEIGTVQPIAELCRLAHEAGALFHTDAAQAAGFLDLDVAETNVDLLSLSAHKIYGPKGIGCLYIKRAVQSQISPLIHGGGQESGLRSGTVPTMLCVGFGEACRFAREEREKNKGLLKELSVRFWKALKTAYPSVILNGDETNRHPGNLNIQFPGIDAHSLLQALQPSVAASTGSACNTGTPEPSYVLRAIGLTDEAAASSIRFSFGLQNSEDQVDRAVNHLINALASIKDITPPDKLNANNNYDLHDDTAKPFGASG